MHEAVLYYMFMFARELMLLQLLYDQIYRLDVSNELTKFWIDEIEYISPKFKLEVYGNSLKLAALQWHNGIF